jgi:hypothetical protein
LSLYLLGVIAALFAMGCGGGGAHGGDTVVSSAKTASAPVVSTPKLAPTAQLSRAELHSRAYAICKRSNFELASAKPRSTSMSEIIRVTPGHVVIELKAAAELESLTPPHSLARRWHAIIARRRALASELLALVQAAKKNDAAGIKTLEASKRRAHDALLTAAAEIGFGGCGAIS